MERTIEGIIGELYSTYYHNIAEVVEIFKDYYEEDKVDLQKASYEDLKYTLYEYIEITYKGQHRTLKQYEEALKLKSDTEYSEFIDWLYRENITDFLINKMYSEILVHFPTITVTNEEDKSIVINNVYVKVYVDWKGKIRGKFEINKSEYTLDQFNSKYIHSHVERADINKLDKFRNVCTGSGPINDTIISLSTKFDKNIWKLFCLELSLFLKVESLAGIPFIRLENVGKSVQSKIDNTMHAISGISMIPTEISLKDFIRYITMKRGISYCYINNNYSIGMDTHSFYKLLSNYFIEWYNKYYSVSRRTLTSLLESKVLYKVNEINGTFYYILENTTINPQDYIGKKLFTFKGKDVTLNITNIVDINSSREFYLLNPDICMYIATMLLNFINCRYGKNSDEDCDKKIKVLI